MTIGSFWSLPTNLVWNRNLQCLAIAALVSEWKMFSLKFSISQVEDRSLETGNGAKSHMLRGVKLTRNISSISYPKSTRQDIGGSSQVHLNYYFQLYLNYYFQWKKKQANLAKTDFKNVNDCSLAFRKMKKKKRLINWKGIQFLPVFKYFFFLRRRWSALPTAFPSTNNKSTSRWGFVSSLMKYLPSEV